MKIINLLAVTLTLSSTIAMADFNLASNGKVVNCFGPDNFSLVIDAARTKIKITVEGESRGYRKITKQGTNGDTFSSFTSMEGTLSLDDRGDVFQYKGDSVDDAYKLDCK